MNNIYNPYLPSYEYIPDGEPHIFGDRLYIYGSHDRFGGHDYCENDYVCWSAPLKDLSEWQYEGEIYNKENHPYREERMLLFAPDVVKGLDGKYYLYYSMAHSSRMSVAVCDTPAGHYKYYGDVRTRDGRVYGIEKGDLLQFDPGVFMDDDGSVYLYSGFCPDKHEDQYGRIMAGAHVCRLLDDMITMDSIPQVIIPRDFDCPEGAGFFEASSMRKFNGRYYFIYSARANGLHYAISDYPDRNFVYAGRLHASSDVGLRGYTPSDTAYPNGNTHGSIILINNQYYVFDHRFTNNCSYCRQGVAEQLNMNEDGLFDAAESTSCGLSDEPLADEGIYPSYIVCFLKNLKLPEGVSKEERMSSMPYVTQDSGDRECGEDAYIAGIRDGCMAGYKYFDMTKEHYKIIISIKGNASGIIKVTTDADYACKRIDEYADCGSVKIDMSRYDDEKWHDVEIDIKADKGVRPIYFIYEGQGCFDMRAFKIEK